MSHPSNGMSAWKPPKKDATSTTCRGRTFGVARPLAADTAMASIAKPIASSSIAEKPTGGL